MRNLSYQNSAQASKPSASVPDTFCSTEYPRGCAPIPPPRLVPRPGDKTPKIALWMYPNTLKNRVGNSQFAPTCPVRSAEHLIGSTYPGELSGIATAVPHGDHPLLVSGRHDIPAMIPSYWLLSDREDVCTFRSTSSSMSVTICLPFWDHPKTQKRGSP